MILRTLAGSLVARILGSLLLVFSLPAAALPDVSLYFYPPYMPPGGTTTLFVNFSDTQYQLFNASLADVNGRPAAWDFSSSGFQYTGGPVNNGCTDGVRPPSTLAFPTNTSMTLSGVYWLYTYPPCTISFEVRYVGTAQSPTIDFPAGLLLNPGSGVNPIPIATSLCIAPIPVVTTTSDTGAGSLRDAITIINAGCAAPYDITFKLPGAAPWVIPVLTQLPPILPAAGANVTMTGGTAGIPEVVLDGTACRGGCTGLVMNGYLQVTGLAIGGFKIAGVEMQGGYGSFFDSYLGTDASGTRRLPNGIGLDVALGAGGSLYNGIVIANGIGIRSAGSASVNSCKVGVDAAGSPAGNGIGVLATDGGVSVQRSEVRGNSGPGIALTGPNTNGDLTNNVAYGNGGPAVDLGNDGVTPNDEVDPGPYDTDTGPNTLLNYPILVATYDGVNTTVTGTLKTATGSYQVDLFENSVPRTTATGGETHLDTQFVDTVNGVATFTVVLPGLHDNLSAMSAVCGEGCSFNSEYSPSVRTQLPGPGVSLSPAALDFGTRSVGSTSPAQTVVLLNNGTVPLAIRNLVISGDFVLTSTCPVTTALAAGAGCTIDVTFSPLVAGARTGTLTVVTNDPASPRTLPLTGQGVVVLLPTLGVDPASLDFGLASLGSTSGPQLVRVSNTGSATLHFAWSTQPPFALVPVPGGAGECGPALDAGGSCLLAVTFAPVIVGGIPGSLLFTSDATNPSVTVALWGQGVAGSIPRALSLPGNLDFGSQPFGLRSTGHTLTVTNVSALPVRIADVAASGDFVVEDACTTLAPRATCVITVYFTPSARGNRGGTLSISVAGDPALYNVALGGVGEANSIPLLAVTPLRVGFGNTVIGPVGALSTLDVTNIGEVPATLGDIAPPGDFLFTSHCPTSLAAGSRCRIDVRFFPRLIGLRAAKVEIPSNASNGPLKVDFSGVGCTSPNAARARIPQLVCQ